MNREDAAKYNALISHNSHGDTNSAVASVLSFVGTQLEDVEHIEREEQSGLIMVVQACEMALRYEADANAA